MSRPPPPNNHHHPPVNANVNVNANANVAGTRAAWSDGTSSKLKFNSAKLKTSASAASSSSSSSLWNAKSNTNAVTDINFNTHTKSKRSMTRTATATTNPPANTAISTTNTNKTNTTNTSSRNTNATPSTRNPNHPPGRVAQPNTNSKRMQVKGLHGNSIGNSSVNNVNVNVNTWPSLTTSTTSTTSTSKTSSRPNTNTNMNTNHPSSTKAKTSLPSKPPPQSRPPPSASASSQSASHSIPTQPSSSSTSGWITAVHSKRKPPQPPSLKQQQPHQQPQPPTKSKAKAKATSKATSTSQTNVATTSTSSKPTKSKQGAHTQTHTLADITTLSSSIKMKSNKQTPWKQSKKAAASQAPPPPPPSSSSSSFPSLSSSSKLAQAAMTTYGRKATAMTKTNTPAATRSKASTTTTSHAIIKPKMKPTTATKTATATTNNNTTKTKMTSATKTANVSSSSSTTTKLKQKPSSSLSLSLSSLLTPKSLKSNSDHHDLNFFQGKMSNQMNATTDIHTNTKTNANNHTLSAPLDATKMKAGKQRLKPRKKKLSTLKKSVLQERLRQWQALHPPTKPQESPLSQSPYNNNYNHSYPNATSQPASSQAQASSSSQLPILTNGNIVCLYQFTFPEELQHDDEYDEIVSDLSDMALKMGPIQNVFVPRPSLSSDHNNNNNDDDDDDDDDDDNNQNHHNNHNNVNDNNNNVGLAFVTFTSQQNAQAALHCWSDMMLGGYRVKTLLVPSYKDVSLKQVQAYFSSENPTSNPNVDSNSKTDKDEENHHNHNIVTTAASAVNANANSNLAANNDNNLVTLILENIITQDDLEDDECLQECHEDIQSLASQFGKVHSLQIMTEEGPEQGWVYVTYVQDGNDDNNDDDGNNGSVRQRAVQGLNGIQIGGQMIQARLLCTTTTNISSPSDLNHSSSETQSTSTSSSALPITASTFKVEPSSEETTTTFMELNDILTEDDFEDDECFEETKDDVTNLIQQYGTINNIVFHRKGDRGGLIEVWLNGGTSKVQEVVEKLHGTLLGGQRISAVLKTKSTTVTATSTNTTMTTNTNTDVDNNTTESIITINTAPTTSSLTSSSSTPSCTIVLDNILTEDDFEDEDCFQETKQDIYDMLSSYGDIASLTIERSGPHKGLVYVTFGSNHHASSNEHEPILQTALQELDGKIIGGTKISAKRMTTTTTTMMSSMVSYEEGNSSTSITATDQTIPTTSINTKNTATAIQEQEQNTQPTVLPTTQPTPMYSGDKIIPPRYAECKSVPKIPNAGIPREYASRIPDDSAVTLLMEMLGELMKFQLRAKDDANARARRRLVLGLREVARGIRSHKVKMVIMANNLDTYGAIDAKLEEILDLAKQEDVPVLFEFNKRKLGKALGKSIKVSVVGIQNADGAHEQFKKLKKLCMLPRVPSVKA